MQITHFLSKHKINIISALVVIAVIIYGCFVFNLFTRGIWALPFDRHPIAVVKTTHQDTGEEKYYTIHANGDHTEIRGPEISELASRGSNEVFFFDHKFSAVKIVSLNYTYEEPSPIRHFHYYDADGNQYDEFPAVSDPTLLAIEKDFLDQLYDLHKLNSRIFRDGDNFYVSALCDCGFGSSARILYRYNPSNHKLDRIGQLKTEEVTDWMYNL